MAKPKNSCIEIELKYTLSKTDYSILKKRLKPHYLETQAQTNYYFDTPNLTLRKKRIGLRIRKQNSKSAVVTLKFPKPTTPNKISSLKVRYEFEEEIPLSVAKTILSKKRNLPSLICQPIKILKSKLSLSTLNQLESLGSLKTERILYRLPNGMILELDKSQFLGKTFFEVEVETTSPKKADTHIQSFFKEIGVHYVPEKTSKLQRFLREWKSQHKKKKV
jgi:uncharacterized protein YjbK